MHTEVYAPQAEAALRFNDERLAIMWPLPVAEISVRDQGHPLLTSKFNGIKLQ
jgi:dTDP-4-dehydrorhamnose 3,5-epimerase